MYYAGKLYICYSNLWCHNSRHTPCYSNLRCRNCRHTRTSCYSNMWHRICREALCYSNPFCRNYRHAFMLLENPRIYCNCISEGVLAAIPWPRWGSSPRCSTPPPPCPWTCWGSSGAPAPPSPHWLRPPLSFTSGRLLSRNFISKRLRHLFNSFWACELFVRTYLN